MINGTLLKFDLGFNIALIFDRIRRSSGIEILGFGNAEQIIYQKIGETLPRYLATQKKADSEFSEIQLTADGEKTMD